MTKPRTILRSLVALPVAMVATLTAHIDVAAAHPPTPPGEMVIKVRGNADLEAILALVEGTVLDTVLGSRGIFLIGVPEGDGDWHSRADKVAKALMKSPGVVYAEQNYDAELVDADRFHYWPSGSAPLAAADAEERRSQPAAEQLNLSEVHAVASGAGVTVAVLDTGVDLDHPDLAGRLLPGYDYVDDDPAPDDLGDGLDNDLDGRIDEGVGHGTHSAGLVSLVAPDATILPMRVLDSEGQGSLFTTAEAIIDATRAGAHVINLSFGTDGRIESRVVKDALKEAKQAGVTIVAAAGNDASGQKHYPAADKDVLSVGALDAEGTGMAAFSNRGKWVTVAAPGTDLVSTVPDGYGRWSGTSMASPLVAGEVALIRQLDPRAKVLDEVKRATRKTADHGVEKGAIDIWLAVSSLR